VAVSKLMGAKVFSVLEIATLRVWSAEQLRLLKEGGATLLGVWGGARRLASNSLLETGGISCLGYYLLDATMAACPVEVKWLLEKWGLDSELILSS
jgi:hypothetical protein